MRQMSRGGLVNVYPKNKIFDTKTDEDVPEKVFRIIDILKFPKTKYEVFNKLKLFGSYWLRIQPYFGDFDTLNFVVLDADRETALDIVVKGIQKIVSNIDKKEGWFCTDIKAGRYENGDSIHWTPEEILKGYKMDDKKITLTEAINQNPDVGEGLPLLKIDLVVPYYDKYIEATSVYLIDCNNSRFYPENIAEPQRILTSLIKDTNKQLSKGKYFKVVKRCFALCRMVYSVFHDKNAYLLASVILPIIGSNISKLSAVSGDISTLALLFETKKQVNVNFATQQIQRYKDTIANIIDLENLDIRKLDEMLDYATSLIHKNYNNDEVINALNSIMEYIQDVNKKEIDLYFSTRGMTFDYFVNEVFKTTILNLDSANIVYPYKPNFGENL